MKIKTLLNVDDVEFIENANGQLSPLEIAQHLKCDLYVITQMLRQIGPATRRAKVSGWAMVRPPAVYSNRKF